MDRADELRRLDSGPRPGERSGLAGVVEIRLETGVDADLVIHRVKDVLRIVLSTTEEELERGEASGLPDWLMETFAPNGPEDDLDGRLWWASPEREKWWGGLSSRTRRLVTTYTPWREWYAPYTLDAWVYSFSEEFRTWFWWDARVDGPDRASVFIEVDGWPYSWFQLEWLLAVAGADVVDNLG
ncbi:MAG: hypothetical protein LBC97_10955 [Bifidobacteriaceae bacterium]|nr:hypothetical protein [Bifidobacteriaceae bacterium]